VSRRPKFRRDLAAAIFGRARIDAMFMDHDA